MFMATKCCKLRFEGGILQLMDAGKQISDLFMVDDAFYNFACVMSCPCGSHHCSSVSF